MFIQIISKPINHSELTDWYNNHYDENNLYDNFINEMLRNGKTEEEAETIWKGIYETVPKDKPDAFYQVTVYNSEIKMLLTFVKHDGEFHFLKLNRVFLDTSKYERIMNKDGNNQISFVSGNERVSPEKIFEKNNLTLDNSKVIEEYNIVHGEAIKTKKGQIVNIEKLEGMTYCQTGAYSSENNGNTIYAYPSYFSRYQTLYSTEYGINGETMNMDTDITVTLRYTIKNTGTINGTDIPKLHFLFSNGNVQGKYDVKDELENSVGKHYKTYKIRANNKFYIDEYNSLCAYVFFEKGSENTNAEVSYCMFTISPPGYNDYINADNITVYGRYWNAGSFYYISDGGLNVNKTIGIIANGKNLFDGNFNNYHRVLPGKTYTFSSDSIPCDVYVDLYTDHKDSIGVTLSGHTFTIPKEIGARYIKIRKKESDTTTINYQLEEGISSTNYEQYIEIRREVGKEDIDGNERDLTLGSYVYMDKHYVDTYENRKYSYFDPFDGEFHVAEYEDNENNNLSFETRSEVTHIWFDTPFLPKMPFNVGVRSQKVLASNEHYDYDVEEKDGDIIYISTLNANFINSSKRDKLIETIIDKFKNMERKGLLK